jgi:hypothetical protein
VVGVGEGVGQHPVDLVGQRPGIERRDSTA